MAKMRNTDGTLVVVKKKTPLYCSFCGKEKGEVAYLVSGPTVFICNECVEMCREIGTKMLVENAVAETLRPTPGR